MLNYIYISLYKVSTLTGIKNKCATFLKVLTNNAHHINQSMHHKYLFRYLKYFNMFNQCWNDILILTA